MGFRMYLAIFFFLPIYKKLAGYFKRRKYFVFLKLVKKKKFFFQGKGEEKRENLFTLLIVFDLF